MTDSKVGKGKKNTELTACTFVINVIMTIIIQQMLLNTYCGPSTVLELGCRVLNEMDKVSTFSELTYSVPGEMDTKGIIPQ